MPERVQKVLSQWGVASRRQAEEMILAGRVKINGQVIGLGEKVDLQQDRLEVDGQRVKPQTRPKPYYLLLHKPRGVVSTCHDPQQRQTVLDLLPKDLRLGQGIHPVGRLDVESTGALLLTNDGDVTFHLTHPCHQVPKTYRVWVEGSPTHSVLQQWRQGIVLEGRKTLPADVKVVEQVERTQTLLEIVLREGRNRQIRRIAEQLGHPVLELHRVSIGPICLIPPGEPALPCGHYRFLKEFEIRFLQTQVSLLSERVPADTKEQSR